MSRLKTNSIGHLVQIMAREVFHEEMEKYSSSHLDLEERMIFMQEDINKIAKDHQELIEQIGNRTTNIYHNVRKSTNAWNVWTHEEKETLRKEYEAAISTIASNHKRSDASIRAYITKLDL